MTNRDVVGSIQPERIDKHAIDFTVMYATHDAFRRDLDRLMNAAVAGNGHASQVDAGWENFKTQLVIHHSSRTATYGPAFGVPVGAKPAISL